MGRVRVINVEIELLEVEPVDETTQDLNNYHNKENRQ